MSHTCCGSWQHWTPTSTNCDRSCLWRRQRQRNVNAVVFDVLLIACVTDATSDAMQLLARIRGETDNSAAADGDDEFDATTKSLKFAARGVC
jgi:hypothetical protein